LITAIVHLTIFFEFGLARRRCRNLSDVKLSWLILLFFNEAKQVRLLKIRMNQSLPESATVTFKHLLLLFCNQKQLDVSVYGLASILGSNSIESGPLFSRVSAVSDYLSSRILNVVEPVHDLLVAVAWLVEVQVINARWTNHGKFVGGGPLPVADLLREIHTLKLLLLCHVENL